MCVQTEVVNRKSLVKCCSLHSLKNKSGSYFLEKIFQPADYKSLRLGSAAVKTQFSYGVWGSPSKRPLTVYAKTVSSLLREST